jgi:hypothetical protein
MSVTLLQPVTDQRIVVAPGLMVCGFTEFPTVDDTTVLRASLARPEVVGGFHLMIVIDGSRVVRLSQLQAEARNNLNDIMRISPLRSAAYVLSMTGFAGTAVRTVFAGFMLLGRKRPEKLFAHIGDAVAFTSSFPDVNARPRRRRSLGCAGQVRHRLTTGRCSFDQAKRASRTTSTPPVSEAT